MMRSSRTLNDTWDTGRNAPLTPDPSPVRGEGRRIAGEVFFSSPLSPCGRGAGGEGASGNCPRIARGHLAQRGLSLIALTSLFVVGTTTATAADAEPLRGTVRLVLDGPLDVVMVDGINKFAERELAESVARRAQFWHRDFSSPKAYEKSVAPNRERLRTILGVVDERVKPDAFELITTTTASSKLARGASYTIHAVRWRVLPGVTAEGLLLQPDAPPVARVIALPDADWTPEEFAALREGVNPFSQVPRHLAESGIEVVVPTLINRSDTWSGNPAIHFTNQPHREFIYRMAFELGRHIAGYEVQKVLAAVDLFEKMGASENRSVPIGVVGVGEGGLLALYSAALDPRVKSTWVSGYFGPREELWREPIYRNVWSILTEFGDAEIASLVLPRALVIEVARAPEIHGPPSSRSGRNGAAPGEIQTVPVRAVQREFIRLSGLAPGLARKASLVGSNFRSGPPGSDRALTAFVGGLLGNGAARAERRDSPRSPLVARC